MIKKKAAFHNLGCKVNAYETEVMEQQLADAGYEIVPFEPGADVYVINTCSVTNIADRKSRQMLHKARKMNPDAIVVAAGCYVQTSPEDAEEDAAIDIVLGNNKKGELLEALAEFARIRQEKSDRVCYSFRESLDHQKPYESMLLKKTQEHTRAYIKVQDGCNQFCSYCIIPYARGRVRSRQLAEILDEIRILAENGCQEVVLTGIHLSSYGIDLGISLLDLICAVHKIPGISRIRLGSLEPMIITENFAKVLASLPKFCPHFHLSLQSGCDTVLKRMNRHYTAEQYAEKCQILRQTFTDPALTTDVIVGFPGENEEEFETTAAYLEQLQLYETHIFKYSRRKGTRAAAMKDQISEAEKALRSEKLIRLGEENRSRFEKKWQGRQVEALLEEEIMIDGRRYYTGYTREYIRVICPSGEDLTNQTLQGVLTREAAPHIYYLTPTAPVCN